jgi:hypothetical protein
MAEFVSPLNIKVMAKSKSFFGLRTGSTKSLTFQVYRGQQITKDRVYRVSNPQTDAQMTQRALIPIVAAARSALKGLVDHSFEGVAYGPASLKEFSKQNLRAGALTVTSYSPNGVSNPGFADLIVSNGSINVPYTVQCEPADNNFETKEDDFPAFAFPAADEATSAVPILKYLETYARENNAKIIAPGTQLSFLTIYESGSVKVDTGGGTIDAPIPNGDSDSGLTISGVYQTQLINKNAIFLPVRRSILTTATKAQELASKADIKQIIPGKGNK